MGKPLTPEQWAVKRKIRDRHEARFHVKSRIIIPRDVAEQLELVRDSPGTKTWSTKDKRRIGQCIAWLKNGSMPVNNVIGKLKAVRTEEIRNDEIIKKSIQRLEEL